MAGLNLWIATRVFNFTQKMSHSKLSLSPVSDLEDNFVIKGQVDWNFRKRLTYKEVGFPLNGDTSEEILYIKVKNRGDLPSTKIKIQMKLKIYKTGITSSYEDMDGTEVFEQERVFHEAHDINITIDYMGADEERLYGITTFHGQVREAELVLLMIHANGHSYFKGNQDDPTIIYQYMYPDFDDAYFNEDGGKSVYGHAEVWEEYEEELIENVQRAIRKTEEIKEKRRQLEEARFYDEID